MEEFGARLRERRGGRVTDNALPDTSADYVRRFEDEYTESIAREMVRGGQARKAAAHNNYCPLRHYRVNSTCEPPARARPTRRARKAPLYCVMFCVDPVDL